jgi:hypothetical protein
MPAIRGIYYNHPQTSEEGIWVWTSWGDIVGFSQTQLDSVKLTGNQAMQELAFKQYVEAGLNSTCQRIKALIGYTTEELDAKAAAPPPHCTVDTNTAEMIINPFVITVTPLSIKSPRRLQIEISDGAYTSNTRFG